MKSHLFLSASTGPLVSVVALFLVGCAVKSANVDMSFSSLLEDVERKAYAIRQFKAELIKTRISGAFDHAVRVHGTLVFQKPGRFRLCFTGDVNVEALSDGNCMRLIHDNQDQETFRLRGDRDLSRFADPLMIIINSIGDGGLRRVSLDESSKKDDEIVLAVIPGDESHFQRIERVLVSLSILGELKKIKIVFKDGDVDDTIFESWTMLAANDPEILDLEARLKGISDVPDPILEGRASGR